MTGTERATNGTLVLLGLGVLAVGALHLLDWLDYQAREKLYRGAK